MRIIALILLSLSLQACVQPSKEPFDKATESYADSIRKSIRDNRAALLACYNTALKKNPDVSGKVVLSWGILTNGLAKDVKLVKSSLKNKNMEACLIKKVSAIKFKAASDADMLYHQVEAYPLVFGKVK